MEIVYYSLGILMGAAICYLLIKLNENKASKQKVFTMEELLNQPSFSCKVVPSNYAMTEFCLSDYVEDEVATITEVVNKGQLKMGDKVSLIIFKEEED